MNVMNVMNNNIIMIIIKTNNNNEESIISHYENFLVCTFSSKNRNN